MLNKDIDYALVGNNFITFLLSIGLINRGKKVLVLDDDRFNYGQLSTCSLTLLDVEFLRNWGESSGILPLKNIDQYITLQPVNYYVGKKQIVLGDTPFRNYRELCRKFPHLFMNLKSGDLLASKADESELYNQNYLDFAIKMTHNLFLEKKSSKVNKIFESLIPPELMGQFNYFFSHFAKKDLMSEQVRSEFNTLIFMTRGFFQNRLSTSGGRSEIIHLFFSLISPYFKLDHKSLIQDLQFVHQAAGGEFKKLNLADLNFQKGLVKSFELESFDGLIRPRKMIFIGGLPEDLPIRLKTTSATYHCLNVIIKFKNPLPKSLINKKILFSSAMKIGTDKPFWEASFLENTSIFNIVVAKREGTKTDFIQERVIKLLNNDLLFLYPEYNLVIESAKMSFTLDFFIEDKDYEAYQKVHSGFRMKLISLLEQSSPLLFSRLKNVLYFGHYNESSYGTFSSLVELLRWRKSL